MLDFTDIHREGIVEAAIVAIDGAGWEHGASDGPAQSGNVMSPAKNVNPTNGSRDAQGGQNAGAVNFYTSSFNEGSAGASSSSYSLTSMIKAIASESLMFSGIHCDNFERKLQVFAELCVELLIQDEDKKKTLSLI